MASWVTGILVWVVAGYPMLMDNPLAKDLLTFSIGMGGVACAILALFGAAGTGAPRVVVPSITGIAFNAFALVLPVMNLLAVLGNFR